MKAIGWIIAGVGGYWLLEQMGYLPNPFTAIAASGNPVTAGATTSSVQANTQTSVVSADTLQQIISAVSAAHVDPNSLQTAWTWNYYYTQVRGVQGPDLSLLFPNNANASTEKFSLQEWWAAMTSAGFNGLGVIARNVNPYANTMGTQFGSYLVPQGSETFIKRIN